MSIKWLLLDGNDVIRSATRRLLRKELGIEVIGVATGFPEALHLTATLKPDVGSIVALPTKPKILACKP